MLEASLVSPLRLGRRGRLGRVIRVLLPPEARRVPRRKVVIDEHRLAFRLAYGREPTSAESERYVQFVDRYRDELAKAGVEPKQAELEAWASVAKTILSSNEFVYLD